MAAVAARGENACAMPGCRNPVAHKCSACSGVKYCGRDCQVAHWPAHKAYCVKPGLKRPAEDPNDDARPAKIAKTNSVATPQAAPGLAARSSSVVAAASNQASPYSTNIPTVRAVYGKPFENTAASAKVQTSFAVSEQPAPARVTAAPPAPKSSPAAAPVAAKPAPTAAATAAVRQPQPAPPAAQTIYGSPPASAAAAGRQGSGAYSRYGDPLSPASVPAPKPAPVPVAAPPSRPVQPPPVAAPPPKPAPPPAAKPAPSPVAAAPKTAAQPVPAPASKASPIVISPSVKPPAAAPVAASFYAPAPAAAKAAPSSAPAPSAAKAAPAIPKAKTPPRAQPPPPQPAPPVAAVAVVTCPVCNQYAGTATEVDRHVDECLTKQSLRDFEDVQEYPGPPPVPNRAPSMPLPAPARPPAPPAPVRQASAPAQSAAPQRVLPNMPLHCPVCKPGTGAMRADALALHIVTVHHRATKKRPCPICLAVGTVIDVHLGTHTHAEHEDLVRSASNMRVDPAPPVAPYAAAPHVHAAGQLRVNLPTPPREATSTYSPLTSPHAITGPLPTLTSAKSAVIHALLEKAASKLVQAEAMEVEMISPHTANGAIPHSLEEVLAADRDDECVICFDSFSAGQRTVRLQCFCLYHHKCIMGWWEKQKHCPTHVDGISIT